MKVHYNPEDDVLMILLSKKKLDDTYETENMLVHVDKNKEPILLEIFHGSSFLQQATKQLPSHVKQKLLSSSHP